MSNRIVVGFKDSETSLAALRWAIKEAKHSSRQLTVVHAASIPITVQNGPTRAAAFAMGDPTWATVHSVVQGFGPPEGTTTIISGGRVAEIIAKYASDEDLVVLGQGPKRWFRSFGTSAQLAKLGYTVRVIGSGSSVPNGLASSRNQQLQPHADEPRQLVS